MATTHSNRSTFRILARVAVRQSNRPPVSRCEPLSPPTLYRGITQKGCMAVQHCAPIQHGNLYSSWMYLSEQQNLHLPVKVSR